MKKHIELAIVLAAAVVTVTQTARADLVNVTASGQLPDLQLVNGAYPVPSQPISEVPANQDSTTLYNWLTLQSIKGDPTPADTVLATGTTTGLGDLSADVGDYIVVHWGAGPVNHPFFDSKAGGGFEQAFLIESGGLGSVDLTLPFFTDKQGNKEDVGGISGYTIFQGVQTPTPVPEAGTTLAGIFCLGLICFGLVRRKLAAGRPV